MLLPSWQAWCISARDGYQLQGASTCSSTGNPTAQSAAGGVMQDSSELQAGRAQAPAERWMRTATRQSLLECCMGAKALFSMPALTRRSSVEKHGCEHRRCRSTVHVRRRQLLQARGTSNRTADSEKSGQEAGASPACCGALLQEGGAGCAGHPGGCHRRGAAPERHSAGGAGPRRAAPRRRGGTEQPGGRREGAHGCKECRQPARH